MVDENDTFEGEDMESGEFAGDEGDGEQDLPSRAVDAEEPDDGTSIVAPDAVLANAQVPEPSLAEVRDADARAREKAARLAEAGPRTPHPRPAMPETTTQLDWNDAIEASAKKDEAKPARPRYVEVAGVKRELRPGEQKTKVAVDVPLTSLEVLAKLDERIQVSKDKHAAIEDLKEWSSIRRGKIKEMAANEKTLDVELETRKRTVYVDALEERDERLHRIVTKRCDTGEIVNERPMSGEERQERLFAGADEDGAADPHDVTAEGVGISEDDAPKTSKRSRGGAKKGGAKGGPKKTSPRATANGAAE